MALDGIQQYVQLKGLQERLDHADLDAYEWPHGFRVHQLIERLLTLNRQRSHA